MAEGYDVRAVDLDDYLDSYSDSSLDLTDVAWAEMSPLTSDLNTDRGAGKVLASGSNADGTMASLGGDTGSRVIKPHIISDSKGTCELFPTVSDKDAVLASGGFDYYQMFPPSNVSDADADRSKVREVKQTAIQLDGVHLSMPFFGDDYQATSAASDERFDILHSRANEREDKTHMKISGSKKRTSVPSTLDSDEPKQRRLKVTMPTDHEHTCKIKPASGLSDVSQMFVSPEEDAWSGLSLSPDADRVAEQVAQWSDLLALNTKSSGPTPPTLPELTDHAANRDSVITPSTSTSGFGDSFLLGLNCPTREGSKTSTDMMQEKRKPDHTTNSKMSEHLKRLIELKKQRPPCQNKQDRQKVHAQKVLKIKDNLTYDQLTKKQIKRQHVQHWLGKHHPQQPIGQSQMQQETADWWIKQQQQNQVQEVKQNIEIKNRKQLIKEQQQQQYLVPSVQQAREMVHQQHERSNISPSRVLLEGGGSFQEGHVYSVRDKHGDEGKFIYENGNLREYDQNIHVAGRINISQRNTVAGSNAPVSRVACALLPTIHVYVRMEDRQLLENNSPYHIKSHSTEETVFAIFKSGKFQCRIKPDCSLFVDGKLEDGQLYKIGNMSGTQLLMVYQHWELQYIIPMRTYAGRLYSEKPPEISEVIFRPVTHAMVGRYYSLLYEDGHIQIMKYENGELNIKFVVYNEPLTTGSQKSIDTNKRVGQIIQEQQLQQQKQQKQHQKQASQKQQPQILLQTDRISGGGDETEIQCCVCRKFQKKDMACSCQWCSLDVFCSLECRQRDNTMTEPNHVCPLVPRRYVHLPPKPVPVPVPVPVITKSDVNPDVNHVMEIFPHLSRVYVAQVLGQAKTNPNRRGQTPLEYVVNCLFENPTSPVFGTYVREAVGNTKGNSHTPQCSSFSVFNLKDTFTSAQSSSGKTPVGINLKKGPSAISTDLRSTEQLIVTDSFKAVKPAIDVSSSSVSSSHDEVTVDNIKQEVSSTSLMTCEACRAKAGPQEVVQCCNNHILCNKCVEKSAKAVLLGDKVAHVACSIKTCSSSVPQSELKKALHSLVLDLLEEKWLKETEEALKNMDDVVKCPNCSVPVILSSGHKYVKCFSCKQEYCRFCNCLWSCRPHDLCTRQSMKKVGDGPGEVTTQVPAYWDEMGNNDETFKLIPVSEQSQEFSEISSPFQSSFSHQMNILGVQRIQNRRLWEKYSLVRSHMISDLGQMHINERRLFHGTRSNTITSICAEGFDWRLCGKHGVAYGHGSYFAKNASYSHTYSSGRTGGKSFTFGQLSASPTQSGFSWGPSAAGVQLYSHANNTFGNTASTGCSLTFSSYPNVPSFALGSAPQPPNAHTNIQPVNSVFSHTPVTTGLPNPSGTFGLFPNSPGFMAYAPGTSSREQADTDGAMFMFVGRVLAGRTCQGTSDMRRPAKDDTNPQGRACHSAVNTVHNPSIFVIFDSNQCYPEYLIKYK